MGDAISKSAVVYLLGRRHFSYHPGLARALGSVESALLVSLLLHWHGRSSDPDWIYKTQDEITDETGLTRRATVRARKQAKAAGVLDERLSGVPARLHYRLHLGELATLLTEQAERESAPVAVSDKTPAKTDMSDKTPAKTGETVDEQTPESDPACVQTSLYDPYKLDCTNRTNLIAQDVQTITRVTHKRNGKSESSDADEREIAALTDLLEKWLELTGATLPKSASKRASDFLAPSFELFKAAGRDGERALALLVDKRERMLADGYTPFRLSGIVPHILRELKQAPARAGRAPQETEQQRVLDELRAALR